MADLRSIVHQKLRCDVEGCGEIFPGPVLLRRHLQVKHKGLKRKASFPPTSESISLKQRLEATSSLPKRELVIPARRSPLSLHEKIERCKSSSSPSAEEAFNATFKREGAARKGGQEQNSIVLKEEKDQNFPGNIQFQAFISGQDLIKSEGEAKPPGPLHYNQSSQVLIKSEGDAKPPGPLYSYNPQYSNVIKASQQKEKVPIPKKVPKERTQFGPKG